MKLNKQLEHARRVFTKLGHKPKMVVNTNDFMVLDWRRADGSNDHFIRYVLDKEMGTLTISGDLGHAVACWWNRVTAVNLKSYVKSTGYFLSKLQCTSDKYTYEEDDIKEDLEECREEYLNSLEGEEKAEAEKLFDKLSEIYEELNYPEPPYDSRITEILDELDTDWWEGPLARLGRRISDRVCFWTVGYQMAIEQLKRTELEPTQKIVIPLDQETALVAEQCPDPGFNEVNVWIQKENVIYQDLAFVREAYDINQEDGQMRIPGVYEVAVYADPEDEDYTHKFCIREVVEKEVTR